MWSSAKFEIARSGQPLGIVAVRGRLWLKSRGELLALFLQLFRHNPA